MPSFSASWGGTAIEPWISYDAYKRAGRVRELMKIEGLGKTSAELEAKYKAEQEKARKKSERERAKQRKQG